MLYSGLIVNKILLVDFQAEQLFLNIDKKDSVELNLYNTKTLTSKCLLNTLTSIKLINLRKYKNVIIDLDGITNSHNLDYLFDSIIEYFKVHSKNIYVVNIHEDLYKQLKFDSCDKTEEYSSPKVCGVNEEVEDPVVLIHSFHISLEDDHTIIDTQLINKFTIFSDLLFDKLRNNKNYYDEKKNKLSNSSDVYLNKYVNIKAFIEDKQFSNYGLFLISQKILTAIRSSKLENQYLFTMTINGSYLATIISRLIGIDISYIDHLGPINKIYKTQLDKRIIAGSNYIVVSDVICLGTEIKIAESIINYENAMVVGFITIVNVKTVSRVPKVPLIYLFEINSSTNKKLKYSITTDLDTK